MSETEQELCVAPGSTNTLTICTSDVLHILILVGGTTDPVNTYINDHRSHSYPGPGDNFYWDKKFYEGIQDLEKEFTNLKVFNYHGWSGDNAVKNREIAGAYLVNRLCGTEGEKAFYERTYQNKDIHFHLLGHSHGGNVINEMTKQMAKLKELWPQKWRVKSITYLSTPFFNSIHQAKVSSRTFHPEAEVLSLFNSYDLTQRMLADFSMEPLAEGLVDLTFDDIKSKINAFVTQSKTIPWLYLAEFTFMGGMREMSHDNGVALYNATITTIDRAVDIIDAILTLLQKLNQDYKYPINGSIKSQVGKPTSSRKLISDNSAQQAQKTFGLLAADIINVRKILEATLDRNIDSPFSKLEYLQTLYTSTQLVSTLSRLLDINPVTLTPTSSNSIWTLLCNILQENIQHYDNTYVDPKRQFSALKVSTVDVTTRDLYHGCNGSKNFVNFISTIENIENRYTSAPSDENLLDLLFNIIVHEDDIYKLLKEITRYKGMINTAEYIATGGLDQLMKTTRRTLENLDTVISARRTRLRINRNRNFEGLTDARHRPKGGELKRGSIDYLLRESHSTSRRVLHPEVKAFLKRLGAKT